MVPLFNHQNQAKTFLLVSRIMDYDPRDFYDEIEAQFADEMEAMGDFQKKPEDDDPSGYMWVAINFLSSRELILML